MQGKDLEEKSGQLIVYAIGLHQRDNDKLLDTLKKLRDLGNTLIVVEHDEDTIRCADYIVDIGPGAGIHGGEIVAQGTLEDIENRSYFEFGEILEAETKGINDAAIRDLGYTKDEPFL